MASAVKLTTEQLMSEGQAIMGRIDELLSMVNQVNSMVETMESSWEGAACQAFAAAYEACQPALRQVPVLMNGMGGQLCEAGSSFAADEQAAQSDFGKIG